MYVDNFYTSYQLATSFLRQNTHVLGTVRPRKKNMPRVVMEAPLQTGEIISRQDRQGIVVLKWKDARDVSLLPTKYAAMLINVRPRGEEQEQELQAKLAHDEQSRTSTGIMRPALSHGEQPSTKYRHHETTA